MKSIFYAAAGFLLLGQVLPAAARESISAILSDPGLDWKDPEQRAASVARIKAIEDRTAAETQAKAKALGLQMITNKPNGGIMQIVGFEGDKPVYRETKNVDAAISTGADLLQSAPYSLDGTGLTVGVWDGGAVRATHQEFAAGNRVTVKDGSAPDDHATHVGGTIAALGASPPAKGMAVNAMIDSYDWNSDTSEMSSRAATGPDQFDSKIYLSNHSYGYVNGWSGATWLGDGKDQNSADYSFGQYSTVSSNLDAVLYNAEYYISFWAAGNDGNDNPTAGSTVWVDGKQVKYDPAKHPPGDGVYRGGFETIAGEGIAKNSITIAAANDAVSSGLRDPSQATLADFSSTGPADDGRIKPDLVANGVDVVSSVATSNFTYDVYSGTSMATPNAVGSATLVVDQYKRLFNSAMRASTLKGLLIHTATDIGNPGPDYKYGWGLVNAQEAADLVIDHHTSPTKERIREDLVTILDTSRTYTFLWDETSPIRATIAWTDPVGSPSSSHDSRTPTLVNDLNIKLIAPDGTEYYPFVMPFVGDWLPATMEENAKTGINSTDNVEQVLIESPGQSGEWQVVVDFAGSLTNVQQRFSLIMSGVLDPNSLKAPSLDSVSINNDAIFTLNSEVTLNHVRTDGYASEYRASENSDLSGEPWLPYVEAPTFTLAGYGVRTVYMQLRNKLGESAVLSDSINVPDPAQAPVLDSLALNGGEEFTESLAVSLNHQWSGGLPTEYRASEDPDMADASWQAYLDVPGFTLADYGERTVYFQIRNANGSSDIVSDSITFARPPTIEVTYGSVPIASGYQSQSDTKGTDFGLVTYGGQAVSRTFTVTNTGDEDLGIQSVSVPVGFVLKEDLSPTIPPGESDTFTVEMSNTLIGTNLGQVRILNADPNVSSYQFTVRGEVDAGQFLSKNQRPVANSDSVGTFEDEDVSITLTGQDANDKPLSYRIMQKPTKGKLTGKAPNLVYVPDADFNGRDSFTFEVDNGLYTSIPAKVDLTITSVNDPPVAKTMKVRLSQGSRKTFRLKGTDADSRPSSLTYKIVEKPQSGSIRWNKKGKVTYIPGEGFAGEDQFTFQISDGKASSKTKTVTLIVRGSGS